MRSLSHLVVLLVALFGILLTNSFAQDDACKYSTEVACLTNSSCSWCKCAAVPSSCQTYQAASKLPPSVFLCGNSTITECEHLKTNATCAKMTSCSWCNVGKAGKTVCANFMNATALIKAGATCTGPY